MSSLRPDGVSPIFLLLQKWRTGSLNNAHATSRCDLSTTYTIHAAKTNLSNLIERAEKGEDIVIARGKQPVARLVPMGVPAHILRRRAFGVLKGKLKLPNSFFFDPLPEEEQGRLSAPANRRRRGGR